MIMSRIYNGIKSYWAKPDANEKKDEVSEDDDVQKLQSQIEKLENGRNSADIMDPGEDEENAEDMKENEAPVYVSDKKTDELKEEEKPRSLVWRLGSGVYSTTTGAVTGAVGLGVGSVKWVAGKSYDAGSAVVGTTKAVVSKVPVPTLKRKDKKE